MFGSAERISYHYLRLGIFFAKVDTSKIVYIGVRGHIGTQSTLNILFNIISDIHDALLDVCGDREILQVIFFFLLL